MIDKDLNILVERLINLDDFAWGKILLSRDPLFYKINTEDTRTLINEAMKYSEELFQKCIVPCNGMTPSTFAVQEKLTVKMDDAPLMEEYLYFGHFYSKPPTIEVSIAALEKVEAAIRELNIPVESCNLRELIIAHEIFHHLEVKEALALSKRAQVTIPVFRKFKRPYRVARISEVAAIYFSKLWLGLSFCPAIFDILLVYGVNPKRAIDLASEQLRKGGR